jgi:hypothetical protein
MNSGKLPVGEGKFKRLVQMAKTGTPDIMAFKKPLMSFRGKGQSYDIEGNTVLFFFEVKVPGNKPTLFQTEKMKELEEHGAKCFVVHSVEEVELLINKLEGKV